MPIPILKLYTNFQQQAEDYRYTLAQQMNDLQIKLIPNKKLADTSKPYSIDKAYWAAVKDFVYKKPLLYATVLNEMMAWFALLFWLAAIWLLFLFLSRALKVI